MKEVFKEVNELVKQEAQQMTEEELLEEEQDGEFYRKKLERHIARVGFPPSHHKKQ